MRSEGRCNQRRFGLTWLQRKGCGVKRFGECSCGVALLGSEFCRLGAES